MLITGANGLLGSELCSHFELKGEQISKFHRAKLSWIDHRVNINQLIPFDCIVHSAANTDVEACELDHDNCYKDNALFTERLAFAASQANCKFIYISSTGIYGTAKKDVPYTEYDQVNPTTCHHHAKWLGEQFVNQYSRNPLIVRAGWLYGGRPDSPKNFVVRRLDEALNSSTGEIHSNVQQRGVPTSIADFAKKLYELIINGEYGTFNIVNQGYASRFHYVSKIVEFANLNVRVSPTYGRSFNRRAKVSDNEAAVALKLAQLGYDILPNWESSLARYVQVDLNDWLLQRCKKNQITDSV